MQKINYENRRYEIISYDPDWKERFLKESIIIKTIFGDKISVEHIGSTSVEGMSGKSCIFISS